ncbi:DNA translocase FtsK [Planococcus koreensis]|uniref:DNA translocase FtsK n=1 Tax=Planococcus koreensis TaxID=112331 RepID=UPI0039FDDB8F
MSWVKNIWNRLFTEAEEEETAENVLKQDKPVPERPKKAPFRFPVISDNEKDRFKETDPAAEQPVPKRRPSSPALNKVRGFGPPAPQVGESYQSPPVREPRERREPREVRVYEKPAPRAPRAAETKTLPRPSQNSQPKPKVREIPAAKRPAARAYEPQSKSSRPFEPSRVPSPIHGYNESRPEPIMNLLEKKEQQRNEQPNLSSLASAKEALKLQGFHNQLPSIKKEAIVEEKLPATEKEISPEPQQAEISAQQQLDGQQPAPVKQKASVLLFDDETEPIEEPAEVKEQEPIEESAEIEEPVHIEGPAEVKEQEPIEEPLEIEEPAAAKELEQSKEPIEIDELETEEQKVHNGALEEAIKAEEIRQPEKKREKIVPFNVLMLKSDKDRLKKTKPAATIVPADLVEKEKPANEPVQKTLVEKQMMSEFAEKKQEPLQEQVKVNEQAPEPVTEPEQPIVYEHPRSDFLRAPENDLIDEAWMEEQGERLIEALSHFQIQASILSIVQGPAVTQFEVTVAQGVKVSKIRNLADDLKLALAAKDIRIQAPIPGKSSIGIEIPNRTSRAVRISEVIESRVFQESDSPLEAALGLDLTGKPVTLDLRKMPHGLIAGATGSGKSVCINSILVSLLYKSSPRDLKMLLIDPKMVKLAPYNHIPHLVSPVITDVKAATASLKWAVEEMERRYQLFAHSGVRDLSRYNKLVKEKGNHAQHLPYILIVIDELADLMMMSPSDVEDAICRIAQKARACGIHLVIATQRPSVDVITGLIKSNIPTRIAFSVSSQVDSRTILDSQGAERLLGRGDMLYLGNGMSAPVRIQGTFVTDNEIEDVIAHVRAQGEPEYFFNEEELIKRSGVSGVQDDLFEEACRFIMSQGSASTSLLQRKFHIGYNRAARLMDLIEQHGFISEQNGSKARAVLITEDDIENVFQ